MKFCFIILHYLTGSDTIECVDSIIKSQKNVDYDIVVIDNGSNNGSYELIRDKFKDNNKIHVIKSEQNIGFARGNNLGFVYAKEELKADFIIMINNDTVITQENFCEIVSSKYNENKYYVLGPDIVTADGCHQNPLFRSFLTLKGCNKTIINQYIHILFTHLRIDDLFLKKFNTDQRNKLQGDLLDTALHGACLIFSKDYIKKFDGLCPDTFLYFEEDILRLYSKSYNFLMMYTSDISIYHKEDVASIAMNPKPLQKKLFVYKNRLKSAKVYKKVYKSLMKKVK